MKRLLLIGLVVVNVVLAGLVIGSMLDMQEAQAQPIGMSGNFLMVAGGVIGTNADMVYVVDLESRQLMAVMYDRSKNETSIRGRRDLVRDLGDQSEEEGERRGLRQRRSRRY